MFLRAGWPARVPCNPAPTDGGIFAAVAGQSGQATCRGPDSPQGCPAIRPLRIGFLSIAIRKVSGGNDVPAGGACPAPTDQEPFVAIAGQEWLGDVPAGRIYPAPTGEEPFAAIEEQGQPGNANGASGTTAPTVGVLSIAIRKVPGGNDVPAGGACPAPTDGGIFAAVAGQSGQATCRKPDCPQGCPAIRPLRWGNICGCRGTERPRNVPAGRIAREGALQSGPYE